MENDIAIKVDHVSKSFKLPHEKQNSIKGALINRFKSGKNTYEKQEVLKDISFEVKKGDFFGIVGRNGSGKSTLLKILAAIYPPNEGDVTVNGKLTPFIELGVGFNPELTGRENVFLNGALLGFNRHEMEEMYSDIVRFAEIERFMDQKLKNYSSGMQVRLAFSIAIRARSDILLLDEVLAVGDEAFQQKCIDVFERYKAQKQTVVLVTHDMASVKKFCNKAMLIDQGKILESGNPDIVADRYSRINQVEIDNQIQAEQTANEATARGISSELSIATTVEPAVKPQLARYLKAKLLSADGKPCLSFDSGDSMIVDLKWPGLTANKIESLGINIFKLSGEHVTGINSRSAKHVADWKTKGEIGLEFKLSLSPGRYYLLIEAFQQEGKVVDAILEGPTFNIRRTKMVWSGLTELPHVWHESS